MPRPTGSCEICGDSFIKVNKLRKICLCCQIIRDVNFSPNRSRGCIKCRVTFWPLKGTYHMCNDCREGEGNAEKYGECKGCGKHLRPAPGLEKFCMSCVMRSKERRMQYVGVLESRRARLVENLPPATDRL